MGWNPLIEWWYKYITEEGFKTEKDHHYFGRRTKINENYSGIEYNGPKCSIIYDVDKNYKKKKDENNELIILRTEQWLYQDFFYENYLSSHVNKGYKLSKKQFWKDLQDKCTGTLNLKRKKEGDGRRLVILLPELEELRTQFNIKQSANYKWEYDEVKDDESESETENDDLDDL